MTHGGLDWQRGHSNDVMPWEILEPSLQYFLNRCEAAPSPAVSFYGGEPLLAGEMLKRGCVFIREHADRPDLRIIIDTNGLMLEHEAMMDLVIQHEVHLQVSLDGPPDIHDRHRVDVVNRPTHTRIMAGLEALVDKSPAVLDRLRFQVTVVDARDLVSVADWFAELPWFVGGPAPTLGLNMADLRGAPGDLRGKGSNGEEARQELWRRHLSALVRGERGDPVSRALFEAPLISYFHRSRRQQGDVLSPAGFCRMGERRLHVTVDGMFQPCERVGSSLKIGDVDRGWNSERVDALERRFCEAMKERCLGCWAQRLCAVCATSLAPTNGVDGSIPVEVCEGVRERTEETFRLWLDLVEAGGEAARFLETSVVR